MVITTLTLVAEVGPVVVVKVLQASSLSLCLFPWCVCMLKDDTTVSLGYLPKDFVLISYLLVIQSLFEPSVLENVGAT